MSVFVPLRACVCVSPVCSLNGHVHYRAMTRETSGDALILFRMKNEKRQDGVRG